MKDIDSESALPSCFDSIDGRCPFGFLAWLTFDNFLIVLYVEQDVNAT